MSKIAARSFVVLFVTAVALLSGCAPTRGHEFTQELWSFCCGGQDCEIAGKVAIEPGGYRVRGEFGGRAVDELVPFRDATPSPSDKFYRCRHKDGSRHCFFAPTPLTQ
jgi:hypothetical protein